MAVKKAPTRGELISLVWANAFASVILVLIIVFSGQYKHFSFWLAAAFLLGLAYLVVRIPDRLKLLRYPLILAGLLLPHGLKLVLQTVSDNPPDIFTASIIFLMAIFWLPLIRALPGRTGIRAILDSNQ